MGDITKEQKFRRLMKFRDEHIGEIRDMYYWHVRRDSGGKHEPRWQGHILWKYPSDIVLYAQAIFANKPDWIIETGTAWGGSAVFFGDMLTLINAPGKVISIDVKPRATPPHPKVEYISGSSTDPAVVERVRKMVSGNVMASLDSDHRERHVRRELRYYSGIVTKGQYLVVEDCHVWSDRMYMPGIAVNWFLERTKGRYQLDNPEEQYIVAISRGGWLKRLR